MTTVKPFAYNSGATVSGFLQVGHLAIFTGGTANLYTAGLNWWMGADEDPGYIVARARESVKTPEFFRSAGKTDAAFINLAQNISKQTFASVSDAYFWVTGQSYYTTMTLGAATTTTTTTAATTTTTTTAATTTTTTTTVGISVTDNFDAYSVGALAGQGNWRTCLNTISLADNAGDKNIYSNSAGNETCVKRSEAFTQNHSSQITIETTGSNSYMGPAVRCSGSGATACYYAMYGSSNNSSAFGIGIVRNGTWNDFVDAATGWDTGLGAGDTLKLTISGNTLTAYRNGSVATDMGDAVIAGFSGTGGVYTIDPAFMTQVGVPGVCGYDTGASLTYGDSFAAQDI